MPTATLLTFQRCVQRLVLIKGITLLAWNGVKNVGAETLNHHHIVILTLLTVICFALGTRLSSVVGALLLIYTNQVYFLLMVKAWTMTDLVKGEVLKSDGACVKQPNNKLLPILAFSGPSNTPEKCVAACRETGYMFAGVKWSKECWCGEEEPPSNSYTTTTRCQMPCSGDKTLKCGGGSVLSLYRTS